MEELYFYNRPFLNYHPYSHIYNDNENNNGSICILIGLIIIIICVLCYLSCFNKNRSYNKNKFTAEQDLKIFNKLSDSGQNNYSALKAELTMPFDVAKNQIIQKKHKQNTLSVKDFE